MIYNLTRSRNVYTSSAILTAVHHFNRRERPYCNLASPSKRSA